MPTLPLPIGSPIVAGDRPVRSADDVMAMLPASYKAKSSAPVRDALIAALTAILEKYQDDAAYAAMQSSMVFSSDQYLSGFAEDHSTPRASSEDDPNLQSRMFAIPASTTRTAIVNALNAMLAPFTAAHVQVYESILDRWFVGTGCLDQVAFVSDNAEGSPHYSDRFYPDDSSENGGLVRPDSSPGGAVVATYEEDRFDVAQGRMLGVRCPDLSYLDTDAAFARYAAVPDSAHSYWWIGDGVTDMCSFIGPSLPTSTDVYNSLLAIVEVLKGAGIRACFYTDTKLGA